ncbi:MAG: 3-dehydroquinate synthase [Agathobacter sp.]|nr:3-dehydroquinate synthase [Agathobacter sp.]
MSVFNVELKKVVDDSYDIEIGYDLKNKLVEDMERGLISNIRKLAVITDSNVCDIYARPICENLLRAGYEVDMFVFPAGEKSKTRETKARIEDAMLEKGYRRDCCIIAVGGGVVTDISGFIAGTYGRGVPFINYATTLLSAADASVGGKTAVDTPLATNLIGMFNQPEKVYIDIASWSTLPEREMKSGMAETIKHACMASEDMFEFLEENMKDIMSFSKFACEYIAENNCQIKYKVVMQDERETGLREILNLGHTVGRAIETVSEYKLLHGEAVAIGLVAQALLSESLGYMKEEQVARVIALLEQAGLPTKIPTYIDREKLVQKLYTDKKVRSGKLRFVLQKGIGNVVEFTPGVYAKQIEEEIVRHILERM